MLSQKFFFVCVIMVYKHGFRIQLSFFFFFCLDDKAKSKSFKCVVVSCSVFFLSSLLFLYSVPFICLFAFSLQVGNITTIFFSLLLFLFMTRILCIVYTKKGGAKLPRTVICQSQNLATKIQQVCYEPLRQGRRLNH